MSKKYYFDNQDDSCYTLAYWRDYMAEYGIKELEIFEAKRESGTGYFFCKEIGEIGETGECGKQCNDYKPRNRKSGICTHYGYTYEKTDKSMILKTD